MALRRCCLIDLLGPQDLGLGQPAQQIQRRPVDLVGEHDQAQAQRARLRERADQLEDVDLRPGERTVEGTGVDRDPQPLAGASRGLECA